MATEAYTPSLSLDLRELRCPHLLITIIKILEEMEPCQVVRVQAADLNAPSSISAWTRQSGHTLLDMYEENEEFIFLIQRQPEANGQLPTINNQQPTSNEPAVH